MSATVRVGLVGLGIISAAHAEGYANVPDVELAAVCDVDPGVLSARAKVLGAAPFARFEDLLDDPNLNLVDICLPHNLHYPFVRAALEAGKHVLVEKPLALTSKDCLELIELAEARGLRLSVAENTRFVTAYVAAAHLISAGELGAPRLVRTLISGSEVERLSNTALWKGRTDGSGGGAIIDAGPHSFYLLKWLFGPIASLRGFHDQLVKQAQVEDNAVVAGTLLSGALFRCEFTFTAEIPWGERLEVYGSKGSLIVDQLINPPAVIFRGGRDYVGEPLSGVAYDPRGWKREAIAAGARDFAEAVATGRAPTVDPRDGLYGVLMSELAYESAAAGGVLKQA
ncbi:MAG: Gfo/Idh/MocA family oxidoreductase [Acidimicrobiales bacterium]|jgi:UDP-N-acetylglucosamine 3-dehydrogenase